jgi:DNA repair protein RadC
MENEQQPIGIKSWSESDRPREKLLEKGRSVLTDSELIAILIRSGSREESAVDLAKKILHSVNYDLTALSRLSVKEMAKFKGMGEVKAITIVAALELGRRRAEAQVIEKKKITGSKDVVTFFEARLSDLPHEEFWILILNRANQIIKVENISKGGISGTVVDSRLIFKSAIENLASGIILCHNHPSGNNKPSQADIDLTKKLAQAGSLLDVKVLDHIIIAGSAYYSFADEGSL